MQDTVCYRVGGGLSVSFLMTTKVALCFSITTEKSGKIVIPLPLKNIWPFAQGNSMYSIYVEKWREGKIKKRADSKK